jgi:hypothetical protein
MYDFIKETNLTDNKCNMEIRPFYTRTRKYCKLTGETTDFVDWEKRAEIFKYAFFSLIFQVYRKEKRVYENSGHNTDDWDFEKTGRFHPKFDLHDESLFLRTLPEVSNQYLEKMMLKG